MNSAGTATTKPGDRAGDADVEQHPLARNRLADADEGAERAGQRQRRGQEERQGRIDVIIAAGEIVTQLMTAEDREDGAAVPEAAQRAAPGSPVPGGVRRSRWRTLA